MHLNHPWGFVSLILWRGYIEETPQGKRRKWPGMLLFRPAQWRHRVELVGRECDACTSTGLAWFGRDGQWMTSPCVACGGRGYIEYPAWSLVVTGPVVRTWGFWTAHGWQQWREYFLERGC